MSKTIINAVCYSLLILLISLLIVSLTPSIHAKELTTKTAVKNDNVFTLYFQTGNALELANIKGITENEVTHMFDVRTLLVIGSLIALGLAIILLIIWEKNKNIFATLLSPLLFLWMSIPFAFFINFNKLFETFHKLFFPQGNYTFPLDSVLITTYPAEFFMSMGCYVVKIFLLITVGLLFIKIISDKLYVLMRRF